MNRKPWPDNGQKLMDTVLGPALAGWATTDGRLAVAGKNPVVPLGEWLSEQGTDATPAYVYSAAAIDATVGRLRSVLPPDLGLHYAIKANPFPPLLAHLAGQVDGFDCASLEEMQRIATMDEARGLGGELLRQCSIAGPAKSQDELDFAARHDVLINVESANELERIAVLAGEKGRRVRVALRVNPPFEIKGSGMRMGGGAKPFGIDSEEIPELIRRLTGGPLSDQLELVGFHVYAGSQCRDADALIETMRQTLALIEDWQKQTDYAPSLINLGGGFGVSYHPADASLDLDALGAGIAPLMAQARAQWSNTRLHIELGRFLVAGAGIYVTRVVDIKTSRGQTYVLCDGGMHHHLALSGNLGQVLRRNWPLVAIDQLTHENNTPVDLSGPLCTPLDVLGQKQPLPPLQVGDLVGVLQSGAYGASASPAGFLSRPAPREFLIT